MTKMDVSRGVQWIYQFVKIDLTQPNPTHRVELVFKG